MRLLSQFQLSPLQMTISLIIKIKFLRKSLLQIIAKTYENRHCGFTAKVKMFEKCLENRQF